MKDEERAIDSGSAKAAAASAGEWDAGLYESRHSFIWQYGAELVELLAPKPGERILDLGCGTGQLTAQIGAAGAQVMGIDNSRGMIEQARRNFPEVRFELADAADFNFEAPFDAIFSNAALHWMKPPERVVRSMARALKPGGRLVAEFGGKGNVRQILAGARRALRALGIMFQQDPNPWYFPSVAEYGSLAESEGLSVIFASLFDRPTALEGEQGMRDWIRMFGQGLLSLAPPERQEELIRLMEATLRPELYRNGTWFADYRRLRVMAIKEPAATE